MTTCQDHQKAIEKLETILATHTSLLQRLVGRLDLVEQMCFEDPINEDGCYDDNDSIDIEEDDHPPPTPLPDAKRYRPDPTKFNFAK